jgi:hypothetical protein
MPNHRKVDLKELARLAMVERLPAVEIAKRIGVSEGTISKNLKKLNLATAQDVTLSAAHKINNSKLDAMEQLTKVNSNANELLDLVMAWGRGDQKAIQVLESQRRKIRIRGTEQDIEKFEFSDPRDLALKAMAEIRKQVALMLDIGKALYNIEEVSAFQKIVLEEIANEQPEIRERIFKRLRQRRNVTGLPGFGGPGL